MGDEMNPICRRAAAAATATATSPTDDENLLPEILLRLPPQPSSLPRASLVCKQWRQLVADPQFLRRFCAHHREAPIIGVFLDFFLGDLSFRPVLDPPNLIPTKRFSALLDGTEGGGDDDDGIWTFRGCRHGRVVFTSGDHVGKGCRQVLVWDPVTGDRRFIGTPPLSDHDWSNSQAQADVLCVDGDKDHVHGSCHSSPFKVVLVCGHKHIVRACVYSSETNSWGNLISTVLPYNTLGCVGSRSILVGNSLHWLIFGFNQTGILELDLDTQSLGAVEVPEYAVTGHHGLYLSTLGGGLGFMAVSDDYKAQVWVRTTDFDGVAGWMPAQTIDLEKFLSLRPGEWTNLQTILGVSGDDNVMFVSTIGGVFMVHLESLQFRKIFERNPFAECSTSTIHPFTSFFAAGI